MRSIISPSVAVTAIRTRRALWIAVVLVFASLAAASSAHAQQSAPIDDSWSGTVTRKAITDQPGDPSYTGSSQYTAQFDGTATGGHGVGSERQTASTVAVGMCAPNTNVYTASASGHDRFGITSLGPGGGAYVLGTTGVGGTGSYTSDGACGTSTNTYAFSVNVGNNAVENEAEGTTSDPNNVKGSHTSHINTYTTVVVTWKMTRSPDRDHDGFPDSSDQCPDEYAPPTSTNGCLDDRPACRDGRDNDGDGLVDFSSDPGCESSGDTDELDKTACSNRTDDDGDRKVDFPADPGCSSKQDDDEVDDCDGTKISLPVGKAVAVGCFTKGKDGLWRTGQTALLSGLVVTPQGSGKFVVDQGAKRVSSKGRALIKIGPLPVWDLRGNSLSTKDAQRSATLEDGGGSLLEDLPLQGEVSLTFKPGYGGSTAFSGKIKVADLGKKLKTLSVATGSALGKSDAAVAFTVGNERRFSLDSVEANIKEIRLIPKLFPGRDFAFKDLHLKYSKVPQGSLWEASGAVTLPSFRKSGAIKSDMSLLGGVQILNGRLIGMKLGAQDINRPIGAGFFLQRASGEFNTIPDWVFRLEATATLGPIRPDPPGPPFAIDPASIAIGEGTKCDKAGLAFEASLKGRTSDLFKDKGLEGSVGGRYCLNFDNPSSSITADLDLTFKANDMKLGGVKGSASGWFVGAQAFNLEGSGKVALPAFPDLNGTFVLSDYGAAACGKFGWFAGGVSYLYYSDSRPHLFEGCDIGPWRSPAAPAAAPAAASAAAAADSRLNVPGGLPFAGFQVNGVGGVPHITLREPGGRTIVTDDTAVNNSQVVVVPSSVDSTAYVFVRKPRAGTWTISPQPGSVAITAVKAAPGLPQPEIDAQVQRRGTKRTLRWRLKPLPGQRVTFYEQGSQLTRELASTTRPRGSKRFSPTLGNTGRRTIVAVVTQNRLPRKRLNVARFSYKRVPLAAPSKLKITRKGPWLRASWKPVPGATGYIVEVRRGKALLARQLTRTTGLRAPAKAKAKLFLRAIDAQGRAGKAQAKRVR